MSTAGAQVGDVAVPLSAPRRTGAWRGQRRRRWWAAATALVAVAAVAAALLVQRSWNTAHQSITWGCCEVPPAGVGIRAVNTFAHYREDLYVPPQRGIFTMFATITNNGRRPVTISEVTLGPLSLPRLAGPVRYARRVPARRQGTALRHLPVLRDVTLGPGDDLFVVIPLRLTCVGIGAWDEDPSFYVTERSLLFARTVAIPWTMNGGALIMGRPQGHGHGSTSCAA